MTPNSAAPCTDDLTPPQRRELGQLTRRVLDVLPPTSGPVDQAIRARFALAAEELG